MELSDSGRISPTMSIHLSHTSDTHLSGNWLLFARVAFLGVAFVALVIWVWGIPVRYVQLGTVCTTTICGDQQPTLSSLAQFHAAGISLSFYAAYISTIEVLFTLVFLLLSALIFWRKSETLIGLITALLLVTFGVTQTDADALAAAIPAWAIPVNLLTLLSFISLGLFLYLFPDGRFTPRWLRFVVLPVVFLFLISSAIFPPEIFFPLFLGFLVVSLPGSDLSLSAGVHSHTAPADQMGRLWRTQRRARFDQPCRRYEFSSACAVTWDMGFPGREHGSLPLRSTHSALDSQRYIAFAPLGYRCPHQQSAGLWQPDRSASSALLWPHFCLTIPISGVVQAE